MENIIVLLICILVILVIYFIFNINIRKIKEAKEDNKIKGIVDKFPNNEEICKAILKMLKNEEVNIKQNDNPKEKTSVYVALTNTIHIANIDNIYTRIQTVAHECLHSVQNKRLLMFNFIFTNIYNIYFVLSIILTVLKIFNNTSLQIIILLFMGITFYIVRAYLENDAMIKAKYLAEKYMHEYIKENEVCSKREVEEVITKYDEINKIGIPAYNFVLFLKPMIKIIVYSVVAFIISFV